MRANIFTAKLYSQSQRINEVYVGKEDIEETQIFIFFIGKNLQPFVKAKQFFYRLSRSWDLKQASELICDALTDLVDSQNLVRFAVMAVYKDEVICVVSPGMGLSILRNGQYGVLLSSQSDTIQITKGKMIVEDVFFFGTTEAFLLGNKIRFLLRQKFPNEYSSSGFLTLGGSGVIYRCNYFSNELSKTYNNSKLLANEKETLEQPFHIKNQKSFGTNLFSNLGSAKRFFIGQKFKPEFDGLSLKDNFFLNSQSIHEKKPRSLTTLAIGLICLLVLLTSVVFGFLKKQEKERRAILEYKTNEIEKELAEAIALAEIAPERARDIFSNAHNKVLGLKDENKQDQKVLLLLKTIEENRKQLLKEYPAEIIQFIDLALLSANFSGSKMILSDNSLYVWDKNGLKLAKIVVSSKRSEIVAGPLPLKDVIDVNVYTDKIYFFYKNGIKRFGDSRFLYEGDFSQDWLFYSYASNFYIVPKDNRVLRMVPGASGNYSNPQSWLKEGSDVDFSDARQIIIDGSIWVLSDATKITKMSNGLVQPFKLSGVSPKLDQIAGIYTSQDSEYLAILDKIDGRIVFVTKDGKFVAQYVAEHFKDAIDFVVLESDRKAFLLTGSKVLFFSLRHLEDL
ncbi:MAG: hypothetical protein NZM26_04385 [Patescibacteria group bacterium]|nr:hypothetical protein [Patescibacteria group bacterium]